jgi:type I restriction enzyme M protein
MAIKKSELYSSIWTGCDLLRGGMDASQYKDYILVLLFVKYVSDKYGDNPRGEIVVPEGGSFDDMIRLKGNVDIGDGMNKIIRRLLEENHLEITVADFNDPEKLGKGNEMVDRLTKLVGIFQDDALNFSSNRADGDDLLGDAYEYLMRNFATESGKSKGQFYTPAEVSRIMSQVIGIENATSPSETIYDPTCGSGSLLLKAVDASELKLSIYGQEKDNATVAMAKMNMILHDNPSAALEIVQGNTLSSPYFVDGDGIRMFDYAVANPPFSDKTWSTGFNPEDDVYSRFEYGIPPNKNGDYAYLMHVIKSLKPNKGKGAIILPHGVLFRGNAEAEIRRRIIRKGFIKGIIGLPANLFYGTGIPACIIVLDKENAHARKGIFMIDASKGFAKDGNKNRLREQDIHKIVDVFNTQTEIDKFSRMVAYAEIESNEYNLNIPRYIDTTEKEDRQDIEAHLLGGIPNADIEDLATYWDEFPSLVNELFEPAERDGYSQLRVESTQIKPTIFSHSEFVAFAKQVKATFDGWCEATIPKLENIAIGDNPKALIKDIGEDLLASVEAIALLDEYDMYQHLMSYWDAVMQDDVYMLVIDGWVEANTLRVLEKKSKETADLTIKRNKYVADLIPPQLIINRYFADEQADLNHLHAELDRTTGEKNDLQEEESGEEGLLAEVIGDNGKISKGNLTKRIKAIQGDPDSLDELAMLKQYQVLMDAESALKSDIKKSEEALYTDVVNHYPSLTESDIQTILIYDKWLATLADDLDSELNRVSQGLTGRIQQLSDRYADTLPELTERAESLSQNVRDHLKRMGFAWD